ncbi:MAG: hypothetical protein HKN39_07535 [Flavobacteriales bacterium]|nr:hypothetical protein [Flavobacteriales bacterium]
MKTTFSYTALFIAGLLMSVNVQAKEVEGKSAKPSKVQAKVADCVPPTGYRQFELNNVRFGIETAGLLWENRPGGSVPDYEVPKGSDTHSIFAGGLWMGGTSPDQQLKLAAITYRQSGTDFWPGPLTLNSATVEPEVCEQFDTHYYIRRQDSELHRLWFNRVQQVADGTLPESVLSEEPFEQGYSVPQYFYDYPAINLDPLSDYNLAPYFDYNGDNFYNPDDGDYPGYDLDGDIDCNAKCAKDAIPLFGDETLWWVFNDKGSIHTEFGGAPIGMEVKAQAFAFTSNDEINNMTFCNYTLINRGTQTLIDTYFGQWVDPDLGCFDDDYVGCDVQRGLGYCYNGDAEDENCSGANGYGIQPPAVGVDFFEGPFQDPDFKDNPDTTDIATAIAEGGIPYPGLGIGYGDGVGDPAFCVDPECCDNERFGMRKFVYYNNDNNPVNGNPDIAVEVYNYLRGFWRNGQRMTWGEDGTNANNTPTDYMFPGDTDPLGWATGGVELSTDWTEAGVDNVPADRRFLQSAGPFILEPGEFNNITVGVVWARALSGGPLESVKELQRADDKAQSLFDNCFRILNGPTAPEVTIQELDQQLVLYINTNNPITGGNIEDYEEFDPTIPDTYTDGSEIPEDEKNYKFQGYKVFQVRDGSVSANDLDNPDLARLAFQCDIEDNDENGNPIDQIINWEFDPALGLVVPTEKVNGANEGLSHTFHVTEDLFASESGKLVNHTKYYFIVTAYGYNNYEDYNYLTQSGMALPYIESRKAAVGDVKTLCGIPHITSPEAGGTIQPAEYGDSFEMIRIEGEGNGGLELRLSDETIDEIMSGEPWRADDLKYLPNFGPVNVRIVDPLNVTDAALELSFFVPEEFSVDEDEKLDEGETFWRISNLSDPSIPDIISEVSIDDRNEQVVPEYGISVLIEQYEFDGSAAQPVAEPLGVTLEFEDPDIQWLSGVPDQDGQTDYNWIRSGTVVDEDNPATPFDETDFNDYSGKDDDEVYENLGGGVVAPWYMTARNNHGPSAEGLSAAHGLTSSDDLSSVHLVFTSDKSKWTRCAVLEIQEEDDLAEDNADKCELRGALSVDKNGRNQDHPNHNQSEATFNGTQVDGDGNSYGMGWFPGYAIDIESGERLNMAFGENSWLAGENGRDMIWNPTSTRFSQTFQERGGGFHYVYVFRNDRRDALSNDRMPVYDGGTYLYNFVEGSSTEKRRVWRSCMWVAFPLLNDGYELLSVEDGLIPTDVTIGINISTEYKRMPTYAYKFPEYYDGAGVDYDEFDPFSDDPQEVNGSSPFIPQYDDAENRWHPKYRFNTEGVKTVTNDVDAAQEALDLINVVPNPYYAFSNYVQDRLDNRVKIVNVPERCVVRIYDASGTLIRKFDKDNPNTYIEWDMKNSVNIPISGGMYIIHVDAPGIGEKVVKFFGVIRPTDLENF